ncbi:MAG: siderophore-interacting protein [Patulibacter sp.]|nr:siderophore-interacting protein [Patulibacter sp.]
MTITVERIRHELEVRLLTVAAAEWLTPSLRRITLTGPLATFASASPDDHVKLIFPFPGETEVVLPELGPQGISRDATRPPMRDYTPRRFDADAGELVIDIVIHGDGPGSTWAAAAEPGTTVGQVGPRGSAVLGGHPNWLLLAGDEAAVPSIARRLEELPPGSRAIVRIEVDGPADELPLWLSVAEGVDLDLVWIHRRLGAAPGDGLVDAVRELPDLHGVGYAWVATEAEAARVLRRHLREERGIPKSASKVTGYWKLGTSDHHDAPEDDA